MKSAKISYQLHNLLNLTNNSHLLFEPIESLMNNDILNVCVLDVLRKLCVSVDPTTLNPINKQLKGAVEIQELGRRHRLKRLKHYSLRSRIKDVLGFFFVLE